MCGECGALLRRHVRTMGTGKKIPAWGCSYRIKEGRDACNSHHVNEDVVYKTYQAAFKKIMDNSAEIIETAEHRYSEVADG